jgi:hypothetical protein
VRHRTLRASFVAGTKSSARRSFIVHFFISIEIKKTWNTVFLHSLYMLVSVISEVWRSISLDFGILFPYTCSSPLFSSLYTIIYDKEKKREESCIYIHTTCFGLIGNLQVYKLVLHCGFQQGNCYCRWFFFSVGSVQPRTCLVSGFCSLNSLLFRCLAVRDVFALQNPIHLLDGRPSYLLFLFVITINLQFCSNTFSNVSIA